MGPDHYPYNTELIYICVLSDAMTKINTKSNL